MEFARYSEFAFLTQTITPISTTTPPTKHSILSGSMERPILNKARSSISTKLSEQLPDPEKFESNRNDPRRSINQIRDKTTVNRESFQTPIESMIYVTNRVKRQPYKQSLPYIGDGKAPAPKLRNYLVDVWKGVW